MSDIERAIKNIMTAYVKKTEVGPYEVSSVETFDGRGWIETMVFSPDSTREEEFHHWHQTREEASAWHDKVVETLTKELEGS